MCAGGSALAEKLVETYFTLFKLILEGKLGHAGQLAAAKEEKASLPGKKGAKPKGKSAQGKGSLPSAKAQRPPSSIEQVTRLCLHALGCIRPAGSGVNSSVQQRHESRSRGMLLSLL